MFCPTCGKSVAEGSPRCSACGATIQLPGSALKDVAGVVKAASRDAWSAFKTFAVNPVQGLPSVFDAFGPSRALGVGIAFGVGFALLLAVGTQRIMGGFAGLLPLGGFVAASGLDSYLKLFVLGLVPFVSIGLASAVARKVFRGSGSLAGDAFVAGSTLLPLALLLLIGWLLGAANVEVIGIASIFAFCYAILILHAGCTTVSAIPGTPAAIAVPTILILSAWVTKIILAALL